MEFTSNRNYRKIIERNDGLLVMMSTENILLSDMIYRTFEVSAW